jgi:DegV family protein with EDD domain
MSKVAIVADSTAYIPPEISAGYPIFSIPLQVVWAGETFRDGVDIQPDEFYRRLQTTKAMPTTSQPTPAAFIDLYSELLDQGYAILSMHISSKLSGTLDSAAQARAHFPGAPIELFDSEATSMMMGFMVMTAARAAAQGSDLQDCLALASQAKERSGVLFVVDTLEFLHRGGRIGGAAAFLGSTLNLKPILELRDGRIEPVERVRTKSKAVDKLLELYRARVGSQRPVHIAALHANAAAEAQDILERARQCFEPAAFSEVLLSGISPVIGTHTGPGTVGLAFMAGME